MASHPALQHPATPAKRPTPAAHAPAAKRPRLLNPNPPMLTTLSLRMSGD